jgi:SAM-dependent methyltransferase
MPLSPEELYNASRGYYDRNASRYEAASWYYFNGYKTAAVSHEISACRELLAGRPSLRVLEIGPGTGYLLHFLLDQQGAPVRYTGIEHSAEMRRILETRHAARCQNFTLIGESVTSGLIAAKVPPASFDLVMGSSILHHLPDYEDVVRALAACVAPGGLLYIVREPIHHTECAPPSSLANGLERVYRAFNGVLMTGPVRRLFWPAKVKAEDASPIAIHMVGNGISARVFDELEGKGFRMVSRRKYNRRVSTVLSFVENAWLARFRKDLYGNTLLAICMQRMS